MNNGSRAAAAGVAAFTGFQWDVWRICKIFAINHSNKFEVAETEFLRCLWCSLEFANFSFMSNFIESLRNILKQKHVHPMRDLLQSKADSFLSTYINNKAC